MNENELRLIRMADVELQKVDWLWFPFIPFGKISMIQGDPGEGKTTLALRLAAACSQGFSLPNTPEQERVPINVIYQTAEDGLGDTIKPRLMDAHADENRIFCIDESEKSLTLLDERIEKAIDRTGARLIILDPVQGLCGGAGRASEQERRRQQFLSRTRLYRLPRRRPKRPSGGQAQA